METSRDFAFNNSLLLTCGGDFHADIYRVRCGVYLPDDVEDGVDIVKYLISTNNIDLCIEDLEKIDLIILTKK